MMFFFGTAKFLRVHASPTKIGRSRTPAAHRATGAPDSFNGHGRRCDATKKGVVSLLFLTGGDHENVQTLTGQDHSLAGRGERGRFRYKTRASTIKATENPHSC